MQLIQYCMRIEGINTPPPRMLQGNVLCSCVNRLPRVHEHLVQYIWSTERFLDNLNNCAFGHICETFANKSLGHQTRFQDNRNNYVIFLIRCLHLLVRLLQW